MSLKLTEILPAIYGAFLSPSPCSCGTALCLRTCVWPCQRSPTLHINPPVRAVGLRFHRDTKSRTHCLLPFHIQLQSFMGLSGNKVYCWAALSDTRTSLPPARLQPQGLQASQGFGSSPRPDKPGGQRIIIDASELKSAMSCHTEQMLRHTLCCILHQNVTDLKPSSDALSHVPVKTHTNV